MNLIKIWLDDERKPDLSWTWVKTVDEAWDLMIKMGLEDTKIDVVSIGDIGLALYARIDQAFIQGVGRDWKVTRFRNHATNPITYRTALKWLEMLGARQWEISNGD